MPTFDELVKKERTQLHAATWAYTIDLELAADAFLAGCFLLTAFGDWASGGTENKNHEHGAQTN
jgi:hypothetical protein